MDNYFTMPKVISALRKKGIGVVGTSRFQVNWPPKILKNIQQPDANFNDFYYCVDEYGTLIARWMDNGLVFVVSTLHHVGNIIKRARKRRRKTIKNKKHVDIVWGKNACQEIFIPTLIDDYNHWMGGVDVADQRIAYYHILLQCLRTWLPMFLQIMSMIRSNSYIVYRSFHRNKSMSHKKFSLKIIEYLMAQAYETHVPYDPTRSFSDMRSSNRNFEISPAPKHVCKKRPRHKTTTTSCSDLLKIPRSEKSNRGASMFR